MLYRGRICEIRGDRQNLGLRQLEKEFSKRRVGGRGLRAAQGYGSASLKEFLHDRVTYAARATCDHRDLAF